MLGQSECAQVRAGRQVHGWLTVEALVTVVLVMTGLAVTANAVGRLGGTAGGCCGDGEYWWSQWCWL